MHKKEFYEQDPRAMLLRDLCLMGIGAASKVGANDESAVELLMDVNQRLGQLGITADIHSIEPEDPYIDSKLAQLEASPRLTSEWVAGQLKQSIEDTGAFTQEFPPTHGDTLDSFEPFEDGPRLHDAPKPVLDTFRFHATMNAVNIFLDGDSGQSGPPYEL